MHRLIGRIAGIALLIALATTGCKKTSSPVEPPSIPPIHIYFNADTLFASTDETLQFSVKRQGGDSTQLEYTWNFGDGSSPVTTLTDTVSHVYSNTGTFVTLCKAAHRNSAITADSATCKVHITAPFEFSPSNKLHIRLKLPGRMHDVKTYYNSGNSWTFDTTYDAIVTFWTEPVGWTVDPDTIPRLDWNGREFSYNIEIKGMPYVTISIYGIFNEDYKSIKEFRCSWYRISGLSSVHSKRWEYQLWDIPRDPPISSSESTFHISGTSLQGHVSQVAWQATDFESTMSNQVRTFGSWFFDERASLTMKFIR